ncbi:DUF3168 domain-containing protein [Methylocystis heyeri]|uniref:DUF3168 domain-containing protein n=1 Tax=Methylocystis heyeri TaxID=391905 RepID=A0A6B8KI26_9HYPH|nr:DUF3168 domain-containing protein [Methylocystis heyeri]QGM46661.1 DUF3168 domain-containing protein [Methylocystis heyeri]
MIDEPSLALQKAIRGALIASSAVTAFVPANAIVDRNRKPDEFPIILLGEDQTLEPEGLARNRWSVYLDLHIWTLETAVSQVKLIAQAVKDALADANIKSLPDYHVADLYVHRSHYMRDPDGFHAHGILTIYAHIQRLT